MEGRTLDELMCGRVIQAQDPTLYTRAVGTAPERPLPNSPPHYNGAPSQDFLVGRRNPKTGETTLDLIRWGLIPSWAKDRKIAWKLINARAETLASASAFKGAFASRRCLVPVDGFFEWRKIGKVKQPYAIGMADQQPFTLAGLWENWRDRDSREWVRTFTIVTTEANELVSKLHDRMPVVIAPADRERWLGDVGPSDLLRPYPAEHMTMWPVSQSVNSPCGLGMNSDHHAAASATCSIVNGDRRAALAVGSDRSPGPNSPPEATS